MKTADLLYGAELLPDLPDGATVAICEGEKAADAVRASGVTAIGTVTGATGAPSVAALRQLARFDVVLWPDNDEAGQGHMQRVAEQLVSLGVTPRMVVWGDAPAKGDAADAPPEDRARLVHEAVSYSPEKLSAGTTHLIGPAETIPLFVTAREFAAATPSEPEWIARPYVARGAITEVAGKLKASGKTTWLLGLCRQVLAGEPFMGFPTVATGAVYLTEQAGASFRAALARAGLLEREDLSILFWSRARGLDWPVIVQAAVAEAQRRGFSLIVVDTLPQFSGVTGDSENSAGAALDAMKPLQEASAEGLAVIVSRHERKGGGDVGESGRGSSAYSGAVDVVLSIRRAEGQSRESVRVIHALSRFDDTPAELVVDLVDGEYRALGTRQDVKAQEARTLVLGLLPSVADEAITTKAILEQLADAGVKRTLLLQVLDELRRAGDVRSVGEGKRKSPFRYWRGHELLSAGTTGVPAESNSDGPEIVEEEIPYDAW
ncbi:MAG: AAA family ATPase [Chloroflexota bacterium]